jgi:lysophospholipase L1-like esterase
VLVVLLGVCVFLSVQLFGAAAGSNSASGAATLPNSYRGGTADPAGGTSSATRAAAGSRSAAPSPTASPEPTPTSSAAPSTTGHQVAGSSVTAIGDSVMVASTPALDQALPGIYIDAMVGRQFSTGLYVLASLKSEGLLRHVVIFALGTNGTVTTDEISQLYAEIGPHRLLVLVNTFEARSWEQEVNSTLAAAVDSHHNTVLANWFGLIEHRTYLLWPDGIHPQPAGGIVYAAMVKAAVDRAGNLAALSTGSPLTRIQRTS